MAVYGGVNVLMGKDVRIEASVAVSCTDGGVLSIGNNTVLRMGCEVVCRGGRLEIGNNVFVGRGAVIVSSDAIFIGSDSLISEYVVIRDQDHATNMRPLRMSGFKTSPVWIGKDCWLGAKVTVIRGSTIGDGAVIGANSLVRGVIPPYTLAAGCPARVIKQLPRP